MSYRQWQSLMEVNDKKYIRVEGIKIKITVNESSMCHTIKKKEIRNEIIILCATQNKLEKQLL